MDDIDYHANVIKVASTVHGFFQKAFRKVNVQGPPLDMDRLKKHPIMVISTHRSQADYFLLGSTVSVRGIRNLRFAAGDNLTGLPILGKKFKQWGAFAVKRRANLGRGYIRELCDQVVEMLRGGDAIIVFPEGGRSYKGEMMEIKAGIVAAGILTQVRYPSNDVMILPVAISYEHLPELLWFDMLAKGKALRKDGASPLRKVWGSVLYFGADIIAFARFLLAHRFGIRYGEVFIDYDAPVALPQLVDLSSTVIAGARDDFAAHRTSMQVLSERLYERFMALYRILPMHVLAAVICDRGVTSVDAAREACEEVVIQLHAQGRNTATLDVLKPIELVRAGARQLSRMKAVRLSGDSFAVDKKWVLQYYARTIRS